jgi:PAS domain S-box-containing protein
MESTLHPTLKELLALGYTDLSLINEGQFRSLLHSIGAAVVVHGADTQIIASNSIAQDLFGMSEQQILGKVATDPTWHFLREDGSDMPLDEYPVNQVLASKSALQNFVVGIDSPDTDDITWALVNAIPIFDDADSVIRIIVSFTDFTDKKLAEQKLVASEQLFRTLVENSPDYIARYDKDLRRVYVNPALQKQFGVPLESILGKTSIETSSPLMAPDRYMENIKRVFDTSIECSDELSYRARDGDIHWASMRFAPELDSNGNVNTVMVISNKITEQKRAEHELKSYLTFLKSLDRINRVLQAEGDLEQILNSTLDEVLEIFECDRAYLQYPCDPNAKDEWRMPIERCVPDYPNPLPPCENLPYHPHIRESMRAMLRSEGPITLGAKADSPIPPEITESLNVQSMIAMALYPKVDRPWQFGIHQCSYERVWTDQEVRLFEEIGRRVSDGLNSLLVARNLQESEAGFRMLFENSPVPLWEEDFSVVKELLDELKQKHGSSVDEYLQEHTEFVEQCAKSIRIIDVNSAVLDLHEADSKEMLLNNLSKTFVSESYDAFRHELGVLARGETAFSFDAIVQTFSGRRKDVTILFSVCPGYEQSLDKVIVSFFDITERKQAEQERKNHLIFLESLNRINRVLQEEGNIEQVLNKALEEIRHIFKSDRCYLLYPCDPNVSSYTVPVESTAQGFPGAKSHGGDVPSDEFLSWVMQATLDSDKPIRLGEGNEFQISELLQVEYGVKSFMVMAMRPRVDNPWQLGMHQCTHERVWSDMEWRLFEEIGRRLADALNSMIISRNLQDSEQRYRQFFDDSPLPIREEDYAAVKIHLDSLGDEFSNDMEGYLKRHPEVVKTCSHLVTVLDINRTSLIFHGAENREVLLNKLDQIFIPESLSDFLIVLVRLMRGETSFHVESVIQTLSGIRQNVLVHFSVAQGYEDSLGKILVSMVDITERKRNEDELRLASSVFTNSQEAIMVSDANNRIIDINPAFSNMTGYTFDEVLGEDPKILSSGKHDQQFFADMWQAIENEGGWRGEIWNKRKSGEVFPELLSIVAVRDDQGNLQHYVGAFTDITMLKQHEADLDRIAHYDVLTSRAIRSKSASCCFSMVISVKAPT